MFKMRLLLIFVCIAFAVLSSTALCSELKTIDKSNYKEVEGLVPEPVLDWIKTGKFIMRIGEPNYDFAATVPSWMRESMSENVGKYDLNENIEIVEMASGKVPEFFKGIPFPEIDPADPRAAAKVMFNGNMFRQNNGPLRTMFRMTFMNGNNNTLERFIKVKFFSAAFVGWEQAEAIPNPDKLEFKTQVLITEPYDMAGTSLMTWRYLDNREDMLFGYIPAIRRVRRLTPASRSDAMFGSDFARDDGSYVAYDGKIGDVDWKLFGEGVILACLVSDDLFLIKVNQNGEFVFQDMNNRKEYAANGYEDYSKNYYDGHVAPWCQTSNVWVKRPVWIIEGRHKNSYYNYGRQIHWIDKDTFACHWKQIFDRSDEYWKMLWMAWTNGVTEDGKEASNLMQSTIVDERINHGTSIDNFCQDCYYISNAKTTDLNQFSMSGFTKLSK